jgi:hypothetical protein
MAGGYKLPAQTEKHGNPPQFQRTHLQAFCGYFQFRDGFNIANIHVGAVVIVRWGGCHPSQDGIVICQK